MVREWGKEITHRMFNIKSWYLIVTRGVCFGSGRHVKPPPWKERIGLGRRVDCANGSRRGFCYAVTERDKQTQQFFNFLVTIKF